MTISLKEYCGYSVEDKINAPVKFKEAAISNYIAPQPDTLMVEVEGIHAYPFHTRNYTRYMPEALKRSEKKWTTPYLRPLIKHHNDQNGEIIGRIYDATYTEQTGVKDIGGLVFTVSVPDEKAAKDVESRILDTVSIGVEADDVRCSICGSPILNANEGCPEGHHRGMVYDNETCYWDVYNIEPKELSYVIVPSDIYAMNKRIYRAKESDSTILDNTKFKESQTTVIKTVGLKEDNASPNNGGTNPDMDLEQKLKEAEEKNEELTKKLEDVASVIKENEELKAKVEELSKTIEEIKEALGKKEEEAKTAASELETSKQDLVIAQQQKEEAEKVGLEAQENYRGVLNEMFALYRDILKKTKIEESEVAKRSIESVCDSIKDFKEEYDEAVKESTIVAIKESKIKNPVPPTDPTPQKQKKNPDYKVDLSEGLQDLFMKLC